MGRAGVDWSAGNAAPFETTNQVAYAKIATAAAAGALMHSDNDNNGTFSSGTASAMLNLGSPV